MLITGHKSILEDALDKLKVDGTYDAFLTLLAGVVPNPNPNHNPTPHTDHVTITQLKKGLSYPDLPCGRFDIKNDKVIMTDASLCAMHRLALDIRKKQGFERDSLTFAYTSHKGRFSTLHAMTFNPHITVRALLEIILDQAVVFAMLSVHDHISESTRTSPRPNAFWLGHLLHLVQDAYSPAHVVRTNTFRSGRQKERRYIKVLKYLSQDKGYVSTDLDDITQELASRFVDKAIAAAIERGKAFADRNAVRKYLVSFAKEDRFPFEITSNKKVDKMVDLFLPFYMFAKHPGVQQIVAPSAPSHPTTRIPNQSHKVINFQYYNNQDSKKHALRDTILYVKQKALHDDVVEDTTAILKMYADVLTASTTSQPEMAAQFTSMVLAYLTQKTFAIEKGCEDLLTGFNMDEVKEEFKELLSTA